MRVSWRKSLHSFLWPHLSSHFELSRQQRGRSNTNLPPTAAAATQVQNRENCPVDADFIRKKQFDINFIQLTSQN